MALMQKRLVSSIGAIKGTLSRRPANPSTSNPPQTNLSEEASVYPSGEEFLTNRILAEGEEELPAQPAEESDAHPKREIETLRVCLTWTRGILVDLKAQKASIHPATARRTAQREDTAVHGIPGYADYIPRSVKDELCSRDPVIHGGVDKEDCTRIEDEFNHGQSSIALRDRRSQRGDRTSSTAATMVNYELPWNPNRLEHPSVAFTATARRKRSRWKLPRSRMDS